MASPIRIVGADITPRGPAPEVGEHTTAVLGELGLSDDELRTLAGAGVIGAADLPDRSA